MWETFITVTLRVGTMKANTMKNMHSIFAAFVSFSCDKNNKQDAHRSGFCEKLLLVAIRTQNYCI